MFQLCGTEDLRPRYTGLIAKVKNGSTAFTLVLIPLCGVLVYIWMGGQAEALEEATHDETITCLRDPNLG
jgi:membrane-associated protease RseP (regulator of RpoE activity)